MLKMLQGENGRGGERRSLFIFGWWTSGDNRSMMEQSLSPYGGSNVGNGFKGSQEGYYDLTTLLPLCFVSPSPKMNYIFYSFLMLYIYVYR